MKPNPRGLAGEEYAARTLEAQGYTIAARNFSSRYGEIDLVAVKDDTVAFVEVKARKRNSMVPGEIAVTAAKQRRIIATALVYMQRTGCGLQPRFDVFCAMTDGAGKILSHDHWMGAFDGGAYGE